jgi:hypothetical protein
MTILSGEHPRALRADGSQEIRCPSCARLLVLRSGPAITPHLAHRPRQSCRNRPGRAPLSPIRLEQLTLFELEIPAISPAPPGSFEPPPVYRPADPAPGFSEAEQPTAAPRPARRRRRAWLPRLIRWLKRRPC